MANSAGSASIDIKPSLARFVKDLKSDLERIDADYQVDVSADLTRFREQIARLDGEDVAVGVTLGPTEKVSTQLGQLARDRTVNIKVDDKGGLAQAEKLTRKLADATLAVESAEVALARAQERRKKVHEDSKSSEVDRAAADLAVKKAEHQITRGKEAKAKIAVDLEGVQQAQAQLAEVARDREVEVDVDVDKKGSLKRAKSDADDAERSLSGMGAVKFAGITAAITALIPALLGVIGAAGGAAGALGAIGGVGLIGSTGLVDTFTAIKEQSKGAGDAADELADKQHNVGKAAKDVADAQQDLADAQRDARKAQQDLAESYEDARRALRDMNDELTDSALSQEDAEISLARAQERRNKVYRDGGSSTLDRAEADLGMKKAQQRLKEARSDHADKATDTQEANRKGIEGSDEVQNAKEAKAAADQKVADAQSKLADAAYNLAKAQKELAKGSGAADKVAQAMANLAPNAQDFVRHMQSLSPAWKELRMAVQDKLFEGLGASVKTFADQNLPGLKTGLTDVAGYMNGTLKQTLTDLSAEFAGLAAGGQLDGLKTAAQSALSGVSPLITGVVNAIATMANTVGPTLGPLFTSLGEVFRQIGPSLGTVGAALSQALTTLMPHLGGFIEALANGLAPVLPVLGKLIGSLGDALQPLIPPLSQVLQVLGNALAEALPIVAPFFAELVSLVGDLFTAVAPNLPILLTLLSSILMPLVGVLRSVVQALAPVIKQMGEKLKPVIAALTPVLKQIGEQLGKALTDAINKLMPFLPQLVQSIVNLALAMLPLLPQFADLAISLLPLLMDIVVATMPHIIKMVQKFTEFAVAVMPTVITIIKKVIEVIKWLMDKIGDLAGWAGKKFGDIVGFVADLPAKIKEKAKGMWDGLKDGFKTVMNAIAKLWNNTMGKLSFTVPPWVLGPMRGKTFSMPKMPEFAGGGYTGPGAKTTPAGLVHAGEHVIRKDSRDRMEKTHPGALDYINATGLLPGYADGGNVEENESADRLMRSMNFAKSLAGTPYQMGGFSPQSIDCSGLVAAVVNVYTTQDGDAWAAGRMSTVNEGDWLRARGFTTGKGGDDAITIGWYDQGGGENGHTAGEFPGGIQFESHGPTGAPAEYGTGQGIDQPIFTDFAHLKVSAKAAEDGNRGDKVTNPDGSHNPSKMDENDGRGEPQKYGPGDGNSKSSGDERYPTSLSGWAGFAAKGIAEGQTKDALGVLGIPDSPNFLSAFSELNKQVRIYDQKSNKTLFGGYDGKDERKRHKLFDTGGWLEPGVTMARNLTGKREAVLTNEQWATAERALAALPPMRSTPSRPDLVGAAAGAGRSGDQVTWNISTARVEDAFTAARQREERRAAAAISRWR